MRLLSYLENGNERVALAGSDRALPAEELIAGGPRTLRDLLDGGPGVIARLVTAAEASRERIEHRGPRIRDLDLLPAVPRPSKVIAVGQNYRAHAAEQGKEPPEAPIVFAKLPSALLGHRGEIRWDPRLTDSVDFEAELAVVIGRRARNVSEAEALDHVLGYTCANDVTARDLQRRDGQWVRAKSLDTFGPIGPAIVTIDEIPDPQALEMRCEVNGEELQRTSTGDMIFDVAYLVHYCSTAFTLEPGDVILTGTPSGVGVFRDPPRFLQDGDEVSVIIEGVGRLTNTCRVLGAEG
jgi:2-keto-4-pentenoate hydratase/2-oxohepta-3-ene-1,7-dioic acid hydratase in catechol pathway